MEYKHRILTMEKKILKTLNHRENFTKLIDAVELCGMEDDLNGSGPLTLFAPTDDAFLSMPPGLLDSLMMDKPKLTEVLKHHIVQDRITSSDAITSKNAISLDGNVIDFETCEGFKVGNAKVIEADIECRNGLIHVIDAVILPKGVILEHQPENLESGDVSVIRGDSKMDKTMMAGNQKMQNMKNTMKDRMGNIKEKMTGDDMNDESMMDKMGDKKNEMKDKMGDKKNEMKDKMGDKKNEMKDKLNK